jgi:transposase-like protein
LAGGKLMKCNYCKDNQIYEIKEYKIELGIPAYFCPTCDEWYYGKNKIPRKKLFLRSLPSS